MEIKTKAREKIQILLVDDHQVVRDGLQHMLEQEGDLKVIGQGANADETIEQIEKLSPDIILMDIKMPGIDGIELTRQVKRRFPGCNIIMLTLYDQYLNQAMEAGASGYLLKDIKCNELARAIRQVHSGQIVTSESIRSKMRLDQDTQDAYGADSDEPLVEEIQLVLPPPVEANQLMRLSGRVEHVLKSRVLQVIGAWEEGTIMTLALNKAMDIDEVLDTLRNIPEIESLGEELPASTISAKLLTKAAAVPKLNNRIRKTIYLTLERK